MSIKGEFEKDLGELLGKVEQGDVTASKSILTIESSGLHHPETVEDFIVLSEKVKEECDLVTKNTELLAELKELTLFECFYRLPELLADIDKKSYRGMSKRRKKRFLSRLRMFETSTGKLASVKHLGKKGFKSIPIIHVFVESIGSPLNDFTDQWLDLFV